MAQKRFQTVFLKVEKVLFACEMLLASAIMLCFLILFSLNIGNKDFFDFIDNILVVCLLLMIVLQIANLLAIPIKKLAKLGEVRLSTILLIVLAPILPSVLVVFFYLGNNY